MGESSVSAGERTVDSAKALIDQLAAHQQVLAAAQARQAALMLEFGRARRQLDDRRIADRAAEGIEQRYVSGEFAAMEIGLAVKASKYSIQRTMAIADRLRAETPDAWDAWLAGHIDQPKAAKINHALLRLTRTSSKQMLNQLVVPVASCKTAELLGRWLNEFVAKAEPDKTDERLRRSLDDRYVSIRPDLDGISFLSAAMSALDAEAVDQVLNAVAGLAEPADPRALQQRRADVLVDLLLGRVSNGCHVIWEDDEDGDPEHEWPAQDSADGPVAEGSETAGSIGESLDEQPWNAEDDWDLPASAFRPDPRSADPRNEAGDPDMSESPLSRRDSPPAGPGRAGRPVITPCPGGDSNRPLPITIGVIVSVQSLFGYSDTPGQLSDRSALVPADVVRDLAAQSGTLFYRLLTDEGGNLLETTELGRFPSRKLGAAVKFRDGTCTNPCCAVPGRRCDLDHVVPVPRGPTTARNLGPNCRPDHRAKTHAGHHTARTGPHTTEWTTPTGHTYVTRDNPLPVESWPDQHE